MRPALELEGNVAHGREVFSQLCATCHRYAELGQDVGPALTEIHRKSKESLLYEILDPNAAVDTKYLNHQIRTTDGNIYSGIVSRETDEAVTLKMAGGMEQVIPKKDIERFQSLGISYMPEGQEAVMGQQDLADLLAFLQQPAS
jgi:putative heme-binding domain-containing protein